MKLKTKILGREWTVDITHKIEQGYRGHAEFPQRLITVKDDLGDSTEHILMHEIVHAFLYECGYQQLFMNDMGTTQEFTCEFIAIHIDNMMEVRDKLMEEIEMEWEKNNE